MIEFHVHCDILFRVLVAALLSALFFLSLAYLPQYRQPPLTALSYCFCTKKMEQSQLLHITRPLTTYFKLLPTHTVPFLLIRPSHVPA